MGTGSWTLSDAWVLAAVGAGRARQALTLREVIGVADWLNHAVLTEGEFTAAIGRLVAAGLVEADAGADAYRATPAGIALLGTWKGGPSGWIGAVPPRLERLGPPDDGASELPPGVFRRAVDDYLSA